MAVRFYWHGLGIRFGVDFSKGYGMVKVEQAEESLYNTYLWAGYSYYDACSTCPPVFTKGKEQAMTTIQNKLYPIKNFPDYYVTKTGDVYSKKYNRDFRKLRPKPQYRGYLLVNLWTDRKQYTKSIHRLVAETFIPNPDNKKQINHKNGIKTDNRVENLEWCSQSENIRHSYKNLNRKAPRQYARWNKGGSNGTR